MPRVVEDRILLAQQCAQFLPFRAGELERGFVAARAFECRTQRGSVGSDLGVELDEPVGHCGFVRAPEKKKARERQGIDITPSRIRAGYCFRRYTERRNTP